MRVGEWGFIWEFVDGFMHHHRRHAKVWSFLPEAVAEEES